MATKNLLVYVPSSAVEHFTTNHIGSEITTSDGYYEKVAFLEGQGTIATHGQIFGTSKAFSDDVTEFKNKVGLTEDITTSSTLTAYAKAVGASVEILNANENTTGSVDKKIKDAIDSLVGNAPDAYNTVYELAEWLKKVQGDGGTAEAVAATLAKVPTLQDRLGTYGIGTYTGAYEFARNVAIESVNALKNSLATVDAAVTGKYVSAVSVSSEGVVTISRESLPALSVATTSTNFMTVNDHEITLITADLGTTSGLSHTTESGTTTYTASTQTVGNGLITASAVYERIHATEEYLATTLTNIDSRIQATVTGATGALDSTITLDATDGSDTLGSITIVEKDGLLASTSDDATTTASLTINKANILKDASATIDSTGNNYIGVHVTEENHKVTAVTVDFSPWEEYTVSGS